MVKNIAKTQQTKETTQLTAHGLLGSLSYWGTTARVLLVSVLLVVAYSLNISVQTDWQSIDVETALLIYGLGTIVLLDAGYVIAARSLKLHAVVDRWVVLLSDILIATVFVTPSFFYSGVFSTRLRVLSVIVALLIVSIRILVGLLFAKRK
jgi:hypothetical protein